MNNPKIITGSANVSQFGFKVTYDFELRRFLFDIQDQTIFTGSNGIEAVNGIAFQVIDPSGYKLDPGSFDDRKIDPTLTSLKTIELPSSFANYGWFLIEGVL